IISPALRAKVSSSGAGSLIDALDGACSGVPLCRLAGNPSCLPLSRSSLLSGNFLPFLACLGQCNGDRLFSAFHLASLAAACALSAAAFVAMHLAAHFLPRATGILPSALLSHWVLLCRNEDGRSAFIRH